MSEQTLQIEEHVILLTVRSNLDLNKLLEAIPNAISHYIEEGHVRQPDGTKGSVGKITTDIQQSQVVESYWNLWGEKS